ncbi:hypothetical protein [Pseudomonas sp. NPDC089569]
MLAMVANDNADCLTRRGAWLSIASMLAPTGEGRCPTVGSHGDFDSLV